MSAQIPCAPLPEGSSSHWSGCGLEYIQLSETAMSIPETHYSEPQAQQDTPVTALPQQHQLLLPGLTITSGADVAVQGPSVRHASQLVSTAWIDPFSEH